MSDLIQVTVWNENRQKKDPNVARVYPEGIHRAIAKHLEGEADLDVRTAHWMNQNMV